MEKSPYTRINYKTYDLHQDESDLKGYADIARIVNPGGLSLRVLCAASGGDLKTPLLTTNSDIFVYVNQEALNESYGGGTIYERMEEEAQILGIPRLTVSGPPHNAFVQYLFPHPQDILLAEKKPRTIHFYAQNYFTFWPPEYENGYDVLIARGEAPEFTTHDIQMRQLGKMKSGGFFISDRPVVRYINPAWIGFKEIDTDAVFPCNHARLFRKDQVVDPHLLSQLFKIDDRIDELDGYHFSNLPHMTIKKIHALLAECQRLPENMRNEAILRAGANMRWVGCENVWKNDTHGQFAFAKHLSTIFTPSFT